MKCLVNDCNNYVYEGSGVNLLILDEDKTPEHRWICRPCYISLTKYDGVKKALIDNRDKSTSS